MIFKIVIEGIITHIKKYKLFLKQNCFVFYILKLNMDFYN